MVLKLYGLMTACTQLVYCVLKEKEIPFEVVFVDMVGSAEHKSEAYLEKNPWGQVPYIDDDGFILYESRAICEYIENKYPKSGNSLLPTDLQARAKFQQMAYAEAHHFYTPALAAVRESIYKPYLPFDAGVYNQNISELDATLAVYDKILSKQKYIAGDTLTLADLYHLPYGMLISWTGSDLMNKYPNVVRWFQEISARPSWKA
ncbi:glutathione S-transferase, partial [Panaeolus papilionaceus]